MLHEPGAPQDVIGPGRALLLDARSFGAFAASDTPAMTSQTDGQANPGDDQATAAEPDDTLADSAGSSQLWLWVHAACYVHARGVLDRQCATHGVQLTSRSAHWRRLELRGPRSTAVLAASLQQVHSPTLQSCWSTHDCMYRVALSRLRT